MDVILLQVLSVLFKPGRHLLHVERGISCLRGLKKPSAVPWVFAQHFGHGFSVMLPSSYKHLCPPVAAMKLLEVRRMLSQPCSILSQSVAGLGILGRSEHPSAASGIFDHKVAERASLVHSDFAQHVVTNGDGVFWLRSHASLAKPGSM